MYIILLLLFNIYFVYATESSSTKYKLGLKHLTQTILLYYGNALIQAEAS